jgi:hypothetical protein
MNCDLCGFQSKFLTEFKYKGKKNTNWNSQEGFTSIVHCPICGDQIIMLIPMPTILLK